MAALLGFYPAASRELLYVEPASLGVSTIGHFGFFQRRFRDTLWSEARTWLLSWERERITRSASCQRSA